MISKGEMPDPKRKKVNPHRQFKTGERLRFRGRDEIYVADKNGTIRKVVAK